MSGVQGSFGGFCLQSHSSPVQLCSLVGSLFRAVVAPEASAQLKVSGLRVGLDIAQHCLNQIT